MLLQYDLNDGKDYMISINYEREELGYYEQYF